MRRPPAARLLLALIAHCVALRGGGASGANANAGADDVANQRPNLRYDVRAEWGGEYDNNAHRTETIRGAENQAIIASPLARAAIGGHLSDVITDGQQVAVSAMLAGKLFTAPAARSENVAITQSSGLWRLSMGARTALNLQAVYYEAFQPANGDPAAADERRDFRSLTPQLQIERRLSDRVAVLAGAGYRWFVFKSDRAFDFQAPVGALDLRWTREATDSGADWELTVGSSLEHRWFAGRALAASGATAVPAARRDNFLVNHLELTRVGAALIGVGYALHWNDSNSFGETLVRHLATVRFTTPLPFAIYLAARAELIIASYRDAVTLGRDPTTAQLLSIDDENRSSVRIDLSRALSADGCLLLLARYTLYENELGVSAAAIRYQRQTAMLSLAFTFER
jgi:hypothetical protein